MTPKVPRQDVSHHFCRAKHASPDHAASAIRTPTLARGRTFPYNFCRLLLPGEKPQRIVVLNPTLACDVLTLKATTRRDATPTCAIQEARRWLPEAGNSGPKRRCFAISLGRSKSMPQRSWAAGGNGNKIASCAALVAPPQGFGRSGERAARVARAVLPAERKPSEQRPKGQEAAAAKVAAIRRGSAAANELTWKNMP